MANKPHGPRQSTIKALYGQMVKAHQQKSFSMSEAFISRGPYVHKQLEVQRYVQRVGPGLSKWIAEEPKMIDAQKVLERGLSQQRKKRAEIPKKPTVPQNGSLVKAAREVARLEKEAASVQKQLATARKGLLKYLGA